MIKEITSTQNKVIKHIKSLHKRNGRKKAMQYFIEGIKVFDEIRQEDQIECILFSETFLENHNEIVEKAKELSSSLYVTSNGIFKEIADTETPQGVLVVLAIKEYNLQQIIEQDQPFFILGDNIQDPGNIGTIIRTADASGAHGVILNKGSVDVYSPKAIRSMMGSQFHIPILYVEDFIETIRILEQKNIRVYAAHLKGEKYYYEMNYIEGSALMIGNESKGISEEVCAVVDQFVKIPMEGKAESLNAGVAAGILMYEVVRQRKVKS